MNSRTVHATHHPHPQLHQRSSAFLRSLVLLLSLTLSLVAFPALAANLPTPVGDLGDAPDSTNNANLPMNAYPGVAANFPTVFTGADPIGPRHNDPRVVWLGPSVSAEADADQLPDEDGRTNLDPGAATATADRDGGDDGWLNQQQTVMRDCTSTVLELAVTRSITPQTSLFANGLFLNVWYDGNRDGDWADTRLCPNQQSVAFEWIVQNAPVNLTQLITSTTATIRVPSFLVLDAPTNTITQTWMRFTLSEQPIPRSVTGAPADGRGPATGFAVGETEDYLYQPPSFATTPGTLVIQKFARNNGTVAIGSQFNYVLNLTNSVNATANVAPLFVSAVDALPPEVELVTPPHVTANSPLNSPNAKFNLGEGPSGTVHWEGDIPAGATVGIEFGVRVRFCTPTQTTIRNTLSAVAGTQTPTPVFADAPIKCSPPQNPPNQLLTKQIIYEREGLSELRSEVSLPPGQDVSFLLTLSPTASLSESFRISDTLPLGLNAVEVSASDGRAVLIDAGRTMLWEGPPSSVPVRIKLRARPTGLARCNERLQNSAVWFSTFHTGASNPTTLIFVCDDLGDAPDSTNHKGATMLAYTGVTASFPTVFDGTDPRGPKHLQPRPIHLGEGVSAETEADQGPDTDGPNNLSFTAAGPRANLDRFDDGVRLSDLKLTICQTATLPMIVFASPNLTTTITATQGLAYLNVWVDGNRDGDWGDSLTCPGTNTVAREHILVDFPVKLADLHPGTQLIQALTSSAVLWPTTATTPPVWLRVTLSERQVPKVLPDGCAGTTCTYGDGRAFSEPYQFGETEDYLVSRTADGQADPTVKKSGTLVPSFESSAGQSQWLANWSVEYFNAGNGPATSVVVADTLQGPQTRTDRSYSRPPLTPVISGGTATYTPGTLEPGQRGFINLQTTLPLTVTPGTVITNTIVLTAPNDVDATNNTAVVTLTVPLLPPLIFDPISGESCTGTLTVTGKVQPGATVELRVDGVMTGTLLTPDSSGVWTSQIALSAGEYTLVAVAHQGSLTSEASAPVKLIVDPTLTWSPISLRFSDSSGHVFTPRNEAGEARADSWRVWLRPTTAYTVTVQVCCGTAGPVVTIDIPGVGSVNLTQISSQPQRFQGTFTTGERAGLSEGTFSLCVTCDLVRYCSDGTVLIDPLGVVYDATKDTTTGLLANATVACYEEVAGSQQLWPADQFGQINPQITAADGFFSFYTPPGGYRLVVTRSGYHTFRSEVIPVADAPVIFNVPMMPLAQGTANYTLYLTENGFEPAVLEVPRGAIVRSVNLTGERRSFVGASGQTTGLAATAGWNSGLLNSGEAFDLTLGSLGTYNVYDGSNPLAGATIIVNSTLKYYVPLVWR